MTVTLSIYEYDMILEALEAAADEADAETAGEAAKRSDALERLHEKLMAARVSRAAKVDGSYSLSFITSEVSR